MKPITTAILLCVLYTTSLIAMDLNLLDESFNESDLFNKNTNLTKTHTPAKADTIPFTKTVAFSGQLRGFSDYGVNRDWMLRRGGQFNQNALYTYTDGDLFLDVRLNKGIKAFADLGLINSSTALATDNSSTSLLNFKELFIDYNIDQAVYFRAGKQFIKWGTTYLWNPIDFNNQERRNFLDMDTIRNGSYGLKVHIPIGMTKNLYFFFNSADAKNLSQLALLTRYETLLNNTELGLSMAHKYHAVSQYGLDLSTRALGLDIKSEAALSYGSNRDRLADENGTLETKRLANQWVPRLSLNLGKSLDYERANRIWINYEVFYNGEGYYENLFNNAAKKDYLTDQNLYEMNYYAAYYHAVFATINEFPFHSTALNINLIQNLIDYSGIALTGLNYTVTDGFNIAGNMVLFFGDDNTEYLQNNYGMLFQVVSTLRF